MADGKYELKADTFQVNLKRENVNTKFPTLRIEMKVGEEPVKLALWMRTGTFGTSFSGNTSEATAFLRALFGSKMSAPPAAQQTPKPTPPPPAPTNPTKYPDVPF